MQGCKPIQEGPRGCRTDPRSNAGLDLQNAEHLLQTALCTGAPARRDPACCPGKAARWAGTRGARTEKYHHRITAFL